MTREKSLVSLDELSAWITEQVQKHDDCEGTSVTVQYQLQQQDADGCNWSDTFISALGPNASETGVTAILNQLLPEARKKFNVK
jgi:hypothetical protein